jgi:hypothetical protein
LDPSPEYPGDSDYLLTPARYRRGGPNPEHRRQGPQTIVAIFSWDSQTHIGNPDETPAPPDRATPN